MAQTIKGKTIKTITVIDPDSKAPVEVSIIKLETGGMIGIDESFLSNTEDDIYSPFDKAVKIDLD